MASFNKVILIGNLTRDPEVRFTPKGTAVGEISLAINRISSVEGERREETTYVDVTLWGRTAELAQQYLTKGRPVMIEGRLQNDTWEDKATGQKRSRMRVVAESMQFLGTKGEGGGAPASRPAGNANANYNPPSRPTSESNYPSSPQGGSPAPDDFEDDDIPF